MRLKTLNLRVVAALRSIVTDLHGHKPRSCFLSSYGLLKGCNVTIHQKIRLVSLYVIL